MGMLREEAKNGGDKGKLSSKRVAGWTLLGMFLILMAIKIFHKLEDVSDASLFATLGGALEQLTATLFKKNT